MLLSKVKKLEASRGGIKYKLVSAGSIKKRKEAVVWLEKEYEKDSFELDGETIDKSQYVSFVVDGKSMRRFGIESGDVVLVKKDHFAITETSIFVLKVFPPKRNKIEYKLRKPIDFYDCQDDSAGKFETWIKEHRLDSEKFKHADIREKIDECKRRGCQLLVSETTRKRQVHYSFHPADRIFGQVEHVIQNENVEIIEKR
ncbi:MAG: hypothetical protein LBK58_10560 [Prevotellaceae bacterium]|jgi:hypothetical protein|nr:hypothetical protein [Prevotellaceae bacterium]